MSEKVRLSREFLSTETVEPYESVRQQMKHLVAFLEGKGYTTAINTAIAEGIEISHGKKITGGPYWNPKDRVVMLPKADRFVGKNIFARTKRHEVAHAVSRNNGRLSRDEKRYTQKVGFAHSHGKISPEEKWCWSRLFWGLNEGMTDMIALKSISPDASAWERFVSNVSSILYRNEVRLLKTIITQVSQHHRHLSEEHVFDLFLESYMHAWSPQLKRILLETYGPNALRILAVISIPQLQKTEPTVGSKWDSIFTFFSLDKSADVREAAARKVLEGTSIRHIPKKD